MKLLITVCLKDYEDDVYDIFNSSKIGVFSTTDVTGFRNDHKSPMLEDWFASGDERFDSLMLFSFTSDENAEKGMELVQKYNKDRNNEFPVRAFIVPVDKASF